jgi:hypothetical protein
MSACESGIDNSSPGNDQANVTSCPTGNGIMVLSNPTNNFTGTINMQVSINGGPFGSGYQSDWLPLLKAMPSSYDKQYASVRVSK